MQKQNLHLPELPLEAWEQTKTTLHLYLQIVGKIRLKMMPRKNHWWYVTLYISPKGLTTHAIPYEDGAETFEITFNFIEHQLEIVTSRGQLETFDLMEGLSVSEFYQQLFATLSRFGIEVTIVNRPYDLPIDKPFSEISEYASYQKEYVQQFWRTMMWVDGVFKEFSGRFYGKTTPVHLYWHSLDLAVTRFSGKQAPPMPAESTVSDKDAYSHEVISFGFWAGDANVREPAFYSYTYPSPEGLSEEPLLPDSANWVNNNGSPMAILRYDDLRQAEHPRKQLLDFLESAYQAGSNLSGWNNEAFKVPPLSEM